MSVTVENETEKYISSQSNVFPVRDSHVSVILRVKYNGEKEGQTLHHKGPECPCIMHDNSHPMRS